MLRGFTLFLFILAAVVFGLETSFLWLPGIQQDEALFLTPFLASQSRLYTLQAGTVQIPLMVMDYIGGLKTWLFWPIFRIWGPTATSIRLPMCFVSICTLIAFARLARRAGGIPMAIASAVLLGLNALFLLTNVFDWGPVALLMLGSVLFIALLARIDESSDRRHLAVAFLLAGAMVWYKAVFVFLLAGLAAAYLSVFRNKTLRACTARNFLFAVAAFSVGASPLIWFNLRSGAATARASSSLEKIPVSEKLVMLRETLNGKALEHYMVRSSPGEILRLHGAPIGDLVKGWYAQSALGPGSFLLWGLLASACALPFIRGSSIYRAVLFAWIAAGVTEGLFLLFRNAGSGPHHTVLLYPAPQFIVAGTIVALAERMAPAAKTKLIGAVIGLVVLSEILLLFKYHQAATQNGFSVYWTDASRNVSATVCDSGAPVAILDWGIETPLRVRCRNSVAIVPAFPVRPGVIYLTHSEGYRINESDTIQFLRAASDHGFRVERISDVPDSHGRTLISVFSLDHSGSTARK